MKASLALWLVGFASSFLFAQGTDAPVPPDPVAEPIEASSASDGTVDEPDVEPLMRGPIHEAFAEPLAAEDTEAFVAPTEPPPNIDEIPPATEQNGSRVDWIPGYWSWDDERQDYIWVSGVWRKAPVGRQWQPGEWFEVDGGYQWVPGRWIVPGVVRGEAIPAPPPSLESGPSSEAESDEAFWVPGVWLHRENRYVWRPGFWSPCHESWVWVPDHYVSVPGGCHFVSGYWDYGWDSRGTLYAPCYINRRLAYRPGWRYSPSVTVDVSSAFFHLWVRPSYCHYYFGDYYADRYASIGFCPWYNYHVAYRRAYDPLFSYYHWQFRRDRVDLYHHLRYRYDHHRRYADSRPRRTWDQQAGRGNRGNRTSPALANAQREALVRRTADRRAAAVSTNQREAIRARVLDEHRERLRSGGQDSLAGNRAGRANRATDGATTRGARQRRSGAVANQSREREDIFRRSRPGDRTTAQRGADGVQRSETQRRSAAKSDQRNASRSNRSAVADSTSGRSDTTRGARPRVQASADGRARPRAVNPRTPGSSNVAQGARRRTGGPANAETNPTGDRRFAPSARRSTARPAERASPRPGQSPSRRVSAADAPSSRSESSSVRRSQSPIAAARPSRETPRPNPSTAPRAVERSTIQPPSRRSQVSATSNRTADSTRQNRVRSATSRSARSRPAVSVPARTAPRGSLRTSPSRSVRSTPRAVRSTPRPAVRSNPGPSRRSAAMGNRSRQVQRSISSRSMSRGRRGN